MDILPKDNNNSASPLFPNFKIIKVLLRDSLKKKINLLGTLDYIQCILSLEKNDFDGAAIRYMNDKGVNFLAVLSNVMVPNDGDSAASQSKSPRREILLIGREETVEKAVDYLLGDPTTSFLEITAVEGQEGKLFPLNGTMVRRRLAQGNPKGSRKQVAPILRDFFA